MIVRWTIISGEPYQGVPLKGDSLLEKEILEKANFPAESQRKTQYEKASFLFKSVTQCLAKTNCSLIYNY